MAAVNYWLSQQASHERPKWRSQRPATPPSFHLRTPDDRDLDAVTWTRATTKSVTDYQGNVHQALSGEVPWEGYRRVQNLVNYSEALGSLSLTRATASANVVANPLDGATTADKLVLDATASSNHYLQHAPYAAAKGEKFIYSGYFKAAELHWVRLEIYMAATAGFCARAYYDLSNAVVGTLSNGTSHGITSLGNGWCRCWVEAAGVTATESIYVGLQLCDGDLDITIDGDGTSGLYVYGLQLERARPGQTAPDEYVSSGVLSTPYHGAKVDGVQYFATDDQGRLIDGTRGYDRDGTGAWVESSDVTPIPPGLVIGSAQTNRITYSSDLTSGWTDSGAGTRTAAYDAQVGVYTQLRSVGASGADDFLYAATGFTGSARTEPAMMLRAVSTSGSLVIENASDNTLGKWTVDLSLVSTTRFERIDRFHAAVTVNTEFTATAGGAAGIRFYVASGSVGFDVSLVTQVEAERVQSLIYSAGSATAKNADVPSFTALPNYASNSAGAVVMDFVPLAPTAVGVNYVSGVRVAYTSAGFAALKSYDGTTSAEYGDRVEGTRTKIAANWQTGVGRYGYRDGVSKFAATAYDGAWESSTLTLAGPQRLRELSLYSSALTAAQLQALSS